VSTTLPKPSSRELILDCQNRAADAPVYDLAQWTPVHEAKRLSSQLGNRLWLKREDLQPTFSFKLRGAYNCMRNLSDSQRQCGVIAASAGNHAQGVALSARELGIDATIFMPRTTPEIKVRAVAELGAKIELVGDDYDEACAHALAEAEGTGAIFIHPFDNMDVIAGQGTIGIEIANQLPEEPEAIFLPVGGGGLAAGVAANVKLVYPNVKVIGVEPADAASMKAAIAAGYPVDIGTTGIFADGVAVRQVGQTTFEMCRELLDDIVTVSVDQVCAAVKSIFEDVRAVAEPAGALAVAGAIEYSARHPVSESSKRGDWVALVSGANVNFDRLGHVVERCAFGDGSEALLSVTIPERPGSFLEFCRLLGASPVTEFNYRHNSTANARVFVGVRLTDSVEVLQGRMEKFGYQVIDLSDNEVAKLHLRHLVGGRLPVEERELLFRFEFPERPGALLEFLEVLAGRWSISLFHYRNHGSAHGRVLAGFLVPQGDDTEFHKFLDDTHYHYTDETGNVIYQEFLSNHDELKQADKQKLHLL
jgi:threonine dehydratase